jgi:hypothetical protein
MSIWDGKVVIVGPGAGGAGVDELAGALAAVVASVDAAAVGAAVGRLEASGVRACGFVGPSDDEAVFQMAAELFPGAEVVVGPPL